MALHDRASDDGLALDILKEWRGLVLRHVLGGHLEGEGPIATSEAWARFPLKRSSMTRARMRRTPNSSDLVFQVATLLPKLL